MISETKIDANFPTYHFFIQEYSTVCRMDRNGKGEGVMLFVKDGIITITFKSFIDKTTCYKSADNPS